MSKKDLGKLLVGAGKTLSRAYNSGAMEEAIQRAARRKDPLPGNLEENLANADRAEQYEDALSKATKKVWNNPTAEVQKPSVAAVQEKKEQLEK